VGVEAIDEVVHDELKLLLRGAGMSTSKPASKSRW
jgi:hypothetical protein